MTDTVYIATADIFAATGVRAYRRGDTVHADAVENLDCRDKVASRASKAAKEAAPKQP